MKVPHVMFPPICQSPPIRSVRSVQSKAAAPTPSFWQHCLKQLIQSLLVRQRIRVTQRHDRAGNTYYEIVDQDSGRIQIFFSETDALIWLDRQRFNH